MTEEASVNAQPADQAQPGSQIVATPTSATVDPQPEVLKVEIPKGESLAGVLKDEAAAKADASKKRLTALEVALLKKQFERKQKAHDRLCKHISKLCKDHIFMAPKLKMKPIEVESLRHHGLTMIKDYVEKTHKLPMAISFAPATPGLPQLSLATVHFAQPVLNAANRDYTSTPKEGEAPDDVLETVIIAGMTDDFPGAVIYRDGTIVGGDPKTCFNDIIKAQMEHEVQHSKRLRTVKRHFGQA